MTSMGGLKKRIANLDHPYPYPYQNKISLTKDRKPEFELRWCGV